MDKTLNTAVLTMKGDVSVTRVQVPPEDRPLSSLRLRYTLVTLQLRLNSADHFALELTIGQSAVQRTKVIIGTHIREPKQEMSLGGMPTAMLPLVIPRNRWVQVVFHLAGIVTSIFGMMPMKSIDAIALCGTAKIGVLKASNSEQACIDSAPGNVALFAVPAYAPPVWVTAAEPTPQPLAKSKEEEAVVADRLAGDASGHRMTNSLPNSPRHVREEPPEDGLANGYYVRGQHLAGGRRVSPTGRAAPVPARLEPLGGDGESYGRRGVCPGSSSDPTTHTRGTSGTPPATAAAPLSSPSSLPVSSPSNGGWGVGMREAATKPAGSPQSSSPSQCPTRTPVAGDYIRLVSSASPRPGPAAKSIAVYGGRQRGCSGNEQQRDASGCAEVNSWWDDVGSWEIPQGSVPASLLSGAGGAAALERQGPTGARERPDGGKSGGDAKTGAGAPAKPKTKMTPEAERVQRLVAARKRKVGLVGATASPSDGGGGGTSEGAGKRTTKRQRTRRRLRIIRANEKQASKMAVAKALAPSEIPIKLALEKDAAALTAEAEGGTGAVDVTSSAVDPAYGYGFGYTGILHDNGEYEEDEGAGLKGGWSLAVSDDEEE